MHLSWGTNDGIRLWKWKLNCKLQVHHSLEFPFWLFFWCSSGKPWESCNLSIFLWQQGPSHVRDTAKLSERSVQASQELLRLANGDPSSESQCCVTRLVFHHQPRHSKVEVGLTELNNLYEDHFRTIPRDRVKFVWGLACADHHSSLWIDLLQVKGRILQRAQSLSLN